MISSGEPPKKSSLGGPTGTYPVSGRVSHRSFFLCSLVHQVGTLRRPSVHCSRSSRGLFSWVEGDFESSGELFLSFSFLSLAHFFSYLLLNTPLFFASSITLQEFHTQLDRHYLPKDATGLVRESISTDASTVLAGGGGGDVRRETGPPGSMGSPGSTGGKKRR